MDSLVASVCSWTCEVELMIKQSIINELRAAGDPQEPQLPLCVESTACQEAPAREKFQTTW